MNREMLTLSVRSDIVDLVDYIADTHDQDRDAVIETALTKTYGALNPNVLANDLREIQNRARDRVLSVQNRHN